MLRVMRRQALVRGAGRVELAVHNGNEARDWYGRLGLAVSRRWVRGEEEWELQGTGVYAPERPGDGSAGGVIMGGDGAEVDRRLLERYGARGEATGGISYHIIDNGIDGLRNANLLQGARAMARRVYAGERWWVEGDRERIECLYRPQSLRHPTHFIIASVDRQVEEDWRVRDEDTGAGSDTGGGEGDKRGAQGGADGGGDNGTRGDNGAGPSAEPRGGGSGAGRGQPADRGGGADGGGQRGSRRSREADTGEGDRRTQSRIEEGEPGTRLMLAAGPATNVCTQVTADQGGEAGGGQESRTSEEEQRWPVAMRLGGALAGAMRGLASRIGGAWGAIRAGKRRREEGVREDEMDKRRRTGDG